MTTSNETCPICATLLLTAAKFCSTCGTRVPELPKCTNCKAVVSDSELFCTACGSLTTDGQEAVPGNCWARRAGDFVSRLEVNDLSAALERRLAVEAGTRGLLFQHGKFLGTLNAGVHTRETVVERIKSLAVDLPFSVVLIDVGDVELSLPTMQVRTCDDQNVDVTIRLLVGLDDPEAFFVDFMKAVPRVTTRGLSEHLQELVHSVMQRIVLESATEELYHDRELVTRIQDELRSELVRNFSRFGLRFSVVEFISFDGLAFGNIRTQPGERRTAEEFDVERQQTNLKFFEVFTQERMCKVQNRADFDRLLNQVQQEADVKVLRRKQVREVLWREYEKMKQDVDIAREHLLATLWWYQIREQWAIEEVHYNRHKRLTHEIETPEKHRMDLCERLAREHRTVLNREQSTGITEQQAGPSVGREELMASRCGRLNCPRCLSQSPIGSLFCGNCDFCFDSLDFTHSRQSSCQSETQGEQHARYKQNDEVQLDLVDCTVFAPPEIAIGGSILIQIFAHKPEQADEAMTTAHEFDNEAHRRGFTSLWTEVALGTQLVFELTMRGFRVDDSVQKLIWSGRPNSTQFEVTAPSNIEPHSAIGSVHISQGTVPIGIIKFKLNVVANTQQQNQGPTGTGEARRYRKAFVSYASTDRDEVLRRVQMLTAVGIEFFQDVLDLKPGDRWHDELYQRIDESDVLFLFWSTAAKNSQWVEKEWRYGLEHKSGDFIRPVIIEGPPIVTPPDELAHLHFSDKVLYFLRSS